MSSDMTLNQSFERFKEGTSKAADRCRMLSAMYGKRQCGETSAIFAGLASALEEIVVRGTKVKNSKGKNRTDTLAALDRIMKANAEINEGK